MSLKATVKKDATENVTESEALKEGIDYLTCLLETSTQVLLNVLDDLRVLVIRSDQLLRHESDKQVDQEGNLFYMVPAGWLYLLSEASTKAKAHL